MPAISPEKIFCIYVIPNICTYFMKPPFRSCFRHNKIFAAFVPVPKTSMYKNYSFIFWQHNIRLPRQPLHMQPIPVPVFMQKPAHQHFGFGILAPDARHIVAAGCFGVYIGHAIKVLQFNNHTVIGSLGHWVIGSLGHWVIGKALI